MNTSTHPSAWTLSSQHDNRRPGEPINHNGRKMQYLFVLLCQTMFLPLVDSLWWQLWYSILHPRRCVNVNINLQKNHLAIHRSTFHAPHSPYQTEDRGYKPRFPSSQKTYLMEEPPHYSLVREGVKIELPHGIVNCMFPTRKNAQNNASKYQARHCFTPSVWPYVWGFLSYLGLLFETTRLGCSQPEGED